jgi:hypothetical protein
MSKKIILATLAIGLVALLPATVSAYGACHAGYTHVGPNGAYHTGTTVGYGPHGAYETSHTTAVSGGGAYHEGYSAGTTGYRGVSGTEYRGVSTTGTTSGYYYAPSHYNAQVNYGYVR